MPRDKDRKRIIRERMKKTGESYTAARSHILARTSSPPAPPSSVDYAGLAGMSDTVIAAKTGRTWSQWLRALDAEGASSMAHRDLATLVHNKFEVADWWTQTVTVGYERIKGLRQRGQRRDGMYDATKSRTFNVPVKALFEAWATPTRRRRWLNGVKVVVRTATSPKSIRLQWPDGTLVAVGFTAKGSSKSAVALAHMKLRDKATSAALKTYWTERLDALASLLGKESSG